MPLRPLALGSTLRVLEVTAHPGDEDGALLLYLSHGVGAQVTLLTLTRGERGDSRMGIVDPTEQGLQRTMEQLASDAHYGAEQRFTRVVDFGFARTANEVFDHWLGHNAALGDMVRVIRETRPEIIVTPFDASAPDGDGQHEAAAILVREAFRAAADAKKFPEQLKDEVEPWQAKRLFALSRSGAYSMAFNADERAVGEAESWQQQAQSALDEQHSQRGIWHAPREAVRHYRLIDSAPGFALAEGAKDFAEGMDSRLESLANLAGLSDETKEQAQSRLHAMSVAAVAVRESLGDPAICAVQIAEYLRNLRLLEDRLVSGSQSGVLRAQLEAKRRLAEQALLLAAGVRVEVRLDDEDESAYVLVPGANFAVHVQVEGAGAAAPATGKGGYESTGDSLAAGAGARVASVELKSEGGRWMPRREWTPGEAHAAFRGRVPMDAPFTRPQFLLEGEDDGTYRILDERNATRALPAAALHVVVELEVAGEIVRASVPVQGRNGNVFSAVMVAPPLSVITEPRTHWNRRTSFAYGEIEVRVRSNVRNLQNALLSVHPPSGWRAEPEHEMLEIEKRGEEHTYRFFLVQERGGEGAFPVRAVVRWGGAVFDQGYTIVRGADNNVGFDYRTSDGWLVSTDVEVPENLEVGYVGVAGDAIPDALRDVHVRVTELDREALMHERLEKYWAIVLGPGAVDARDDVGEVRSRLLQYEEQGGAVVILGQTDAERFARYAPLPYPVELGSARVSNEACAVEMLDEHDPLFLEPNEIGAAEWRGWNEERGRNFAQRWDGHYEALLRMRDTGQPVQEGSLIRTRFGRGSVVYTGLSFSRQLPAGVAGAMRLLVNLLSPGADLHR
jgi:LmbE family N-acetylglucosaminyl deacetylase